MVSLVFVTASGDTDRQLSKRKNSSNSDKKNGLLVRENPNTYADSDERRSVAELVSTGHRKRMEPWVLCIVCYCLVGMHELCVGNIEYLFAQTV